MKYLKKSAASIAAVPYSVFFIICTSIPFEFDVSTTLLSSCFLLGSSFLSQPTRIKDNTSNKINNFLGENKNAYY